MYAEQLISKQGPLGHVWLAANYDKRLSKQQMLNTSIVKSSEIILSHPVNHSTSQSLQSSESITLRLSGQLLLGIVRIYSRKTKYLLDDVNDILLRLKNSFKYASGVNLGFENSARLVNVNPQQTTIRNVENITLPDQVTNFELLYQDDLNLEDDVAMMPSQDDTNEETFSFDQSIEYPRREETPAENDMELELDFDLGEDNSNMHNSTLDNSMMDQSIEVGREAPPPQMELPDISVLEGLKETNEPPFGLDLDAPLETIDDTFENEIAQEEPDTITESSTPSAVNERQPRKRTGLSDEGELITNKRKLKVDSNEELEGISIQTLKENQDNLLQSNFQYGILNLPEKEKLEIIYNLSAPITNKRRKLWNINNDLLRLCQEESRLQEKELEEQHELQFENEGDFSNIDFDLSLPGFDSLENSDSERPMSPDDIDAEEARRIEEEDLVEEFVENTARSTIQIASQLRDHFIARDDTMNMDEIIKKDLEIQQRDQHSLPLGTVNTPSDNKFLSHKKEAAKCFFEMLVLATNDCVSIEQEPSLSEIGGIINIRSRDKLFQSFL